jgi:hypothetical protein
MYQHKKKGLSKKKSLMQELQNIFGLFISE